MTQWSWQQLDLVACITMQGTRRWQQAALWLRHGCVVTCVRVLTKRMGMGYVAIIPETASKYGSLLHAASLFRVACSLRDSAACGYCCSVANSFTDRVTDPCKPSAKHAQPAGCLHPTRMSGESPDSLGLDMLSRQPQLAGTA